MTCMDRGGEVEVAGVHDFDLEKTFECGQCFRWAADDSGAYTGVAMGRVARLRRVGDSVFVSGTMEDFEGIWRGYFDLDRDYAKIRALLSIGGFMQKATDFGGGIRILRQDRWEALCSFIISQRNNIPRIKGIIAALCREFGEEIGSGGGASFAFQSASRAGSGGGASFAFQSASRAGSGGVASYSFPSASRLAALCAADLEPLHCGYRAPYIIGAARAVASGALDLDYISRLAPDAARAELKKLRGVGDKVADCAVLFGFNMLDAFPVDVWMKRAIAEHFGPGFDPAAFSPYAGIAQQYIFYYMRNAKKILHS